MANRQLFNRQTSLPSTQGYRNKAGGRAYQFSDEHALCQYVVTGTFNSTFYASAGEQLQKVKDLVAGVSPELIAKAAVYGHEVAKMKDIPAYLLAVLAAQGELELLRKAFPRVITNAKMLCNFVQIVRSGDTGRKSFGSAIKRLIQDWLLNQHPEKLFRGSIGQANPSIGDIIKMVHPAPRTPEQAATFSYLIGKNEHTTNLPELIREFELFKAGDTVVVPNVPFRALTNCNLSDLHWKQIAEDMPWNTLRLNLNMLSRNGVFKDTNLTQTLAAKLRDPEEVRRNNVFPYQLLTAYLNANDVPTSIKLALQDALEVATENVPEFGQDVVVAIDISGSMGSPATGFRYGSTSVVTCRDVAALLAACVLRKNPSALVFGWDTRIHSVNLNPKDSIVTNCQGLRLPGGGTDASVALHHLNSINHKAGLVIYVSDNQSWFNNRHTWGDSTRMVQEWSKFKGRNKNAKLVCIDVQPYGDTQAPDSNDVLNIGGFNDTVFTTIERFVNRGDTNFVQTVKDITL